MLLKGTGNTTTILGFDSNWWEAGGASGAVAVYQPKGAASLAASYTDLSGTGNDAAPGVAPTWSESDGWVWNGSAYLTTTIVPSNSDTIIVRFALIPASNKFLAGVQNNYIQAWGSQFRRSSTVRSYTPSLGTGVICMAGNIAYKNGVAGNSIATGTAPSQVYYIGALNNSGSPYGELSSGSIQALAIYDNALSAAQVAAVTTAMQAL